MLIPSLEVDCNVGWAKDNQVVIRQCVPLAGTGIVPGSTVHYSGWGAVDRDSDIYLWIEFFASTDCTESALAGTLQVEDALELQWTRFELSPPFTVPANAASVEYRLAVLDSVDSSMFLALLDGAYLGAAPLLFTDNLEGSAPNPCRWSSESP